MKIAAIGDLHIQEHYSGFYKELFAEMHNHADVLILCGDLTQFGLVVEAEHLAVEARAARIPILAIFGNHDYQSNQLPEIRKILNNAKIILLDEEPFEYNGIGFVGVKGFGGGFDNHTLTSFGETVIKQFVAETINEALALENALHTVSTKKNVVALHYSPIAETMAGEPLEIFPFLGSSRLEETINRFNVQAVFHGHAHHGKLEGRTSRGIPVYNCTYELMKKKNPRRPYVVIEL